ncbi:hypothetical protein TrVE_jg1552 [Triparma verrucosa]|uniref:Uncharacterized protein n=1 Tax=Triparma verrucosa TaxID=1606542 RepID=A0A9W7FLA6_9STRA|nr:hypothetical protein TrVE_jg1552 [Triparma verrucosa]
MSSPSPLPPSTSPLSLNRLGLITLTSSPSIPKSSTLTHIGSTKVGHLEYDKIVELTRDKKPSDLKWRHPSSSVLKIRNALATPRHVRKLRSEGGGKHGKGVVRFSPIFRGFKGEKENNPSPATPAPSSTPSSKAQPSPFPSPSTPFNPTSDLRSCMLSPSWTIDPGSLKTPKFKIRQTSGPFVTEGSPTADPHDKTTVETTQDIIEENYDPVKSAIKCISDSSIRESSSSPKLIKDTKSQSFRSDGPESSPSLRQSVQASSATAPEALKSETKQTYNPTVVGLVGNVEECPSVKAPAEKESETSKYHDGEEHVSSFESPYNVGLVGNVEECPAPAPLGLVGNVEESNPPPAPLPSKSSTPNLRPASLTSSVQPFSPHSEPPSVLKAIKYLSNLPNLPLTTPSKDIDKSYLTTRSHRSYRSLEFTTPGTIFGTPVEIPSPPSSSSSSFIISPSKLKLSYIKSCQSAEELEGIIGLLEVEHGGRFKNLIRVATKRYTDIVSGRKVEEEEEEEDKEESFYVYPDSTSVDQSVVLDVEVNVLRSLKEEEVELRRGMVQDGRQRGGEGEEENEMPREEEANDNVDADAIVTNPPQPQHQPQPQTQTRICMGCESLRSKLVRTVPSSVAERQLNDLLSLQKENDSNKILIKKLSSSQPQACAQCASTLSALSSLKSLKLSRDAEADSCIQYLESSLLTLTRKHERTSRKLLASRCALSARQKLGESENEENSRLKNDLEMSSYLLSMKNNEIATLTTKLEDEISRFEDNIKSFDSEIEEKNAVKKELEKTKEEVRMATERYERKFEDAQKLNDEVVRLKGLLVTASQSSSSSPSQPQPSLSADKEATYRLEISSLHTQLQNAGTRVSMEIYKLALSDLDDLNKEAREREKEKEILEEKCMKLEREVMKIKGKKPPTPPKKSGTPHRTSVAAPLTTPVPPSTSAPYRTPLSSFGSRSELTARLKSVRSSGKKPTLRPAPAAAAFDRRKSPNLNKAFMASKQRKVFRKRLGKELEKEN